MITILLLLLLLLLEVLIWYETWKLLTTTQDKLS